MHLNTLLHRLVDRLPHHSEAAADELHQAVDAAVPHPDAEPDATPADAGTPADKTPTNPKG
jgi:hypothetical protein